MPVTSTISRYTIFIFLFVWCTHLAGQDPAKKIKIVAFGNSTTAERKKEREALIYEVQQESNIQSKVIEARRNKGTSKNPLLIYSSDC